MILTAASTVTAAAVGFASGVVWHLTGWRPLPPLAAVAVVAIAAIADRFRHPLSIRRQVPQAWGRLFSPAGAALLYGARLGPGPLTVLNTWLWWAAAVIAASLGPWRAALVSGAFGASRVAVMLAAGPRAGRWRRTERRVAAAIAAIAVTGAVAAASLLQAGPSGPGPAAAAAVDTRVGTAGSGSQMGVDDRRRRATTSVPVVPADVASELSARLPDDGGPGLTRLDDDPADGLGPLDLQAAAEAEVDVTAERSLLETRSFEAGHARAWAGRDGRTAYVAIYRFATAEEAEAYRRDGAIALDGRGVQQHPLEVPAGAWGFSDATDAADGGRVTHGVAFVRGRHFVLVLMSSRSSDAGGQQAARALAIAAAERNET